MRLSRGKIGSRYIVYKINLEDSIKRRLEMLGMTEKSKVDIINGKPSGTMIIRVRGTRFAIGRRFAEGIIVGGEGSGR